MIISSILGIGALIALLIDAPIWVFGAIVLCLLIEIKILDIEADYWAGQYNILLDDRAGLYEAYCILKRLIAHIKLTKTIKSVVK